MSLNASSSGLQKDHKGAVPFFSFLHPFKCHLLKAPIKGAHRQRVANLDSSLELLIRLSEKNIHKHSQF